MNIFITWLGATISLVGLLSYFFLFFRYPILRDTPWINVPLAVIGIMIAVYGLFKTIKTSPGLLTRSLSISGFLLSATCSTLLLGYVFWLSYQIPIAKAPELLSLAPDFNLKDQHNQYTSLKSFNGKNVILTFFRGHW